MNDVGLFFNLRLQTLRVNLKHSFSHENLTYLVNLVNKIQFKNGCFEGLQTSEK